MYTGFGMPANRMQKSALTAIKTSCKIYDVFETNLEKKLIKECESIDEAAAFLGIRNSFVSNIIRAKSRHKNKFLGKVVTIR